jgi:hypothetical protein
VSGEAKSDMGRSILRTGNYVLLQCKHGDCKCRVLVETNAAFRASDVEVVPSRDCSRCHHALAQFHAMSTAMRSVAASGQSHSHT